MRGQGGAWLLVCGLWAPGDPQFECSLPVACGALSRATVEFPSCSWEPNMESKLKNEEGLKNPGVNQDSKAMKTNEQLTNGNDPDLSDDCLTDRSTDLDEYVYDLVEALPNKEPKKRSAVSTNSQDATELDRRKAGDITNCPADVSVAIHTGDERAGCDESDSESSDLILIEDKPPLVEISSDEEVTAERSERICQLGSKYSKRKTTTDKSEVIRGASKSADVSEYPAKCAESLPESSNSSKPEPVKSESRITATTNLTMKEYFSRFLNEGLSFHEAVDKVKELLLQENDKELQGAGTNRTWRERENRQFNREKLEVYNLWQKRGFDHQSAWAKVELLEHLTEESPDGIPSHSSSKPARSGPQPCKPSSAHTNSSGEFSSCRKTSILPAATTNPVTRSQGSGPLLPQQANNEPKSSFLPCSEPRKAMHPNLGRISLPLNSQNIIYVPQTPPVTAFTSSASVLQAGVLISSFNNGSIPNSSVTHSTGTRLLPGMPPAPAPMPPVPAPVPPVSTRRRREHVSEEDGPPKRSRFEEQRTVPVQTAGVQSKHKKDPASPPNPLHLWIVHSDYPKERLSDEQMDAIENSILEAILEIDDERMKPTFEESFRKKGRYEIVCQNVLAKTWLDKYASCMYEPWPNASLKIIPAEPESDIAAHVLLPLCADDDNDKILRFIGKQNSGLNTDLWEVVLRSDDDASTSLGLLIDEASAKILRDKSKINFKMGTADVELIEDPKAKRRKSSNRSSDRQSATARGLGSSVSGRGRADEHVSSRSSSAGRRHKKRRNDPRDERHRRSKKPAGVPKKERKIHRKKKVTADIQVTEGLKSKHRRSSVLRSNESGSSRGSRGSSSSREGGRADEVVSSSSHRLERGMIPDDKRHLGLDVPSRLSSSELDRHMKPSRYDHPYESTSDRNPELYEARYGPSGSCDRRESRVPGLQPDPVGGSWSGPGPSRQYRQDISEPNEWWPTRSLHPECSRSRYIESGGLPRQPADKPMVSGRSYSPREPSKYLELSHPSRSPSSDYFQERHALELSTSRRPGPEYRWSSDRSAYSESFGSSRPYHTLSEPYVLPRFAAIENSWQVHTQRTVHFWSPPDPVVPTRTDLPQQSAAAGEHIQSDRSPLGSSYSSPPEHQRRSVRSPPPSSTK